MSALDLTGVSHRYPGAPAPTLDRVDLAVEEGEMLAVVGPSGSGKTTLLRIAAGLTRPDSGLVRLDGREVTALPPEQRDLTVMFQQPHLFNHIDVLDNVAFGPRLQGQSRRQARATAQRYLELVHLAGLGARRAPQLSGGQQQRVALARALATERPVLLLDEPFSALDTELRGAMHVLLGEVRAALSPTVLMVTHDLDEAALADTVAVLVEGRFAQVGPVADLYSRPASVTVARLVGGFNEVPGVVVGGRHESALGSVRLPHGCADLGPATLLVRREQLVVGPAGGAGLAGRVVGIRQSGPRQLLEVEPSAPSPSAGAGDLAAVARLEIELVLGARSRVGESVSVSVDPGHPVWAVAGGAPTGRSLVGGPVA